MTASCRYPCDTDCDASCHQDHLVSWKRDPAECANCEGPPIHWADGHFMSLANYLRLTNPKGMRLAEERRRWEVLRYRWPSVSKVKSEYYRRRR
jgi:hypothetical protein